jgi:hypothetical protein
MLPDTGDTVDVAMLGETWVVAYCEDGYVTPCGWPLARVPVEKVYVVERADEVKRLALLHEMAALSSSDPRRAYAQRRLAGIESAPRGAEGE